MWLRNRQDWWKEAATAFDSGYFSRRFDLALTIMQSISGTRHKGNDNY